jgi:hypothetical protein
LLYADELSVVVVAADVKGLCQASKVCRCSPASHSLGKPSLRTVIVLLTSTLLAVFVLYGSARSSVLIVKWGFI